MSGQAAGSELQARGTRLELGQGLLRALARAPAWALTAAAGCVYLIAAPASADLTAATYRSDLFGREGFTLWDNAWYGGHHLPAYSVLAPALGWLVGPRLLATASLVVTVALFGLLIAGRFPPRATRVASLWFAIGAAFALLSCRVPFDLGLAIGCGALLAAQRGRRALALALAALCSLASPVAGGFLALAALTWWLSLGPARRVGWLILAALAPIAALALAFPEGGIQPFVASAFYPAFAGVLAIAALIGPNAGDGARALRAGALLYAVGLLGAYLLHTPVGGNADRLGAMGAGPLAALAILAGAETRGSHAGLRALLARRRVAALAALAPALLYWQATAPVTDFLSAARDPAVNASYYTPLLAELRTLGIGYGARAARIEVVPTADHWEAQFVASQVSIARGWERQLDGLRNGLFYARAAPDAARLQEWLREEAISYVALADSPLDYSGTAEARLVGQAPPFLREVWRSAHWRLFAVADPSPLAQPPATLSQLGSDSFTLRAPAAGQYAVRVRFTPYWRLSNGSGCVARGPGDWTVLSLPRGGSFHVVIGFSLARLFEHGPRCR